MTKIPFNFGLFWSGGPMSYLRYLTFRSLRHYHPDAQITLYISHKYSNNTNWFSEQQDFQHIESGVDYKDYLPEINVNIKEYISYEDFAPNYQSDFFRWWFLKEYGGFYLDTDQIITRSFRGLPLENDFIYSNYNTKSCGPYYPVGVVGAKKESILLNEICEILPKFTDLNDYNSLGPNMFKSVYKAKKWPESHFNAPSSYFYPVPESHMVNELYEGRVPLSEFKDSYAIHWFGGSPLSQSFNQEYTEDFAQVSEDSISKFLRSEMII